MNIKSDYYGALVQYHYEDIISKSILGYYTIKWILNVLFVPFRSFTCSLAGFFIYFFLINKEKFSTLFINFYYDYGVPKKTRILFLKNGEWKKIENKRSFKFPLSQFIGILFTRPDVISVRGTFKPIYT